MEVVLSLIILALLFLYACLVNQSREPDRWGHITKLKKLEEACGPEDSMAGEMI